MKVINNKIKIQALCDLNNAAIVCSGFIEILSIEHHEAYVSWQMFDKRGRNIAGVSQRYYLEEESQTKDIITEIVIANIENFRSGRKYIFSDVKIAQTEQPNTRLYS